MKAGNTLFAVLASFALIGAAAEARRQAGPIEIPAIGLENDPTFQNEPATARFLTQATFGPTPGEVNRLTGTSASAWFIDQLQTSPSLLMPEYRRYEAMSADEDEFSEFAAYGLNFAFWRNANLAEDQLRQRMAFALSQILVVSAFGGELLSDQPIIVTRYQDILIENAFGNYRDLLEAVTYSPAMGFYLTYLGNQKADPATGRMPDENYARELLQLFTLGVVELDAQGRPVTGDDGLPRELYDNRDITGLARVFTGLTLADAGDEPDLEAVEEDAWLRSMMIAPEDHSPEAKSFLGLTIPAGVEAAASIDMALDHIMAHPNVGPFVGRQLIQRFVTSDPSPDYVARVATAFDRGVYVLPAGQQVGEGRRGDLSAALAAVLFDPAARDLAALDDDGFGKIREPVIRITNWARAFNAPADQPEYVMPLWEIGELTGQQAYQARSVFNFYRPGFQAPRSLTGAADMTVPELQLVDAAYTAGYANLMTMLVYAEWQEEPEELREFFAESGVRYSAAAARRAYAPSYRTEARLAHDPGRLIDHLDGLLTYGALSEDTRRALIDILDIVELDDPDDDEARMERVRLAVFLMLTSPDFLLQR